MNRIHKIYIIENNHNKSNINIIFLHFIKIKLFKFMFTFTTSNTCQKSIENCFNFHQIKKKLLKSNNGNFNKTFGIYSLLKFIMKWLLS